MDFPLLVFTDLDGTLLDHHTYSYKGAEKALDRLHRLAIPLVLTSSKTKAELLKLQVELGLNDPFIAENGGGIFVPADYSQLAASSLEDFGRLRGQRFGMEYSHIREVFVTLQQKYHIRGFGDMSPEEIMVITGLSREDAILAARRDFTEPFLFLDEPRPEELQKEIFEQGLTVTRGGRFFHMMAAGQDKGRAVTTATALFQAACPDRITTIGLGDAANDFPMLKVVDIPVLVPRPDGSFMNLDLAGLRKAPYPGSRGWGTVMTDILDSFHLAGLQPLTEDSH